MRFVAHNSIHYYVFVNYAKNFAYNAILKFPDKGPIMLKNVPIMLRNASIMLKVLALFSSNLYIQNRV